MHLTDDGERIVFTDGDRLAFVTLDDPPRLLTVPRPVTNDEVSWEATELDAPEGERFTLGWVADDSDAILWATGPPFEGHMYEVPPEEFRDRITFTILCGEKRP